MLEALRFFDEEHIGLSRHDFFPRTDTIGIEAAVSPEGHDSIPQECLIGGKVTVQKAAELGKDGKVVEFLRIKKMCITDLVDVRNLPTARERQARMKSLSERHPGLQHKGAWPGSLNSYEHDHLEDPAHSGMYVPHFIALGQSEFGEDKILDIVHVPAVEDMEANAVDGGSSPLSGPVDTIRGPGKYGARIGGIIDAANKRVERPMRSADRDGARLAKRLRRRARHYVDNAGFEPGFGVAGLKGARPRAALTPREDGLPIPMSRAGNGIQRICPMAIPGAACLAGGRQKAPAGAAAGAQGPMLIDGPGPYWHPQRQGRMLRSPGRLARRSAIQAVCSTHSPYFVWLEEIGRVRRLQKAGWQTGACKTSIRRIAGAAQP